MKTYLKPEHFRITTNEAIVESAWIDPEFAKEIGAKIQTDNNISIKTGRGEIKLFDYKIIVEFDPIECDILDATRNINILLNFIEGNPSKIDSEILSCIKNKIELHNWIKKSKSKDVMIDIRKLNRILNIYIETKQISRVYLNDAGLFDGHQIEILFVNNLINSLDIVG